MCQTIIFAKNYVHSFTSTHPEYEYCRVFTSPLLSMTHFFLIEVLIKFALILHTIDYSLEEINTFAALYICLKDIFINFLPNSFN